MVSLANCCGEHRCSHGYRGHRARDQHAALLRLRAMDVWRPTVKLGRCPGGILIRCLNHLNWLLSTQRSSSSTPSPSQMAELLTLKIGHPCFFWVRYRFLTVSPCSFQMSESNSTSVSDIISQSFEYSHPPPHPFTAYLQCLYPPAAALHSLRSAIMLWEHHVGAQHKVVVVVGCKDEHTTLHRVPAAEDRRVAWIQFIFEGNVPGTVSKNCLCVLTTSRQTVSPTPVSTRQD